jgi:LPS sulfotransferase NodH
MGMVESSRSGGAQSASRSKAPVFIVGCPRSGTTLLYHMLLSAGNFVVYRTESQAFNLLEPRFGNLQIAKNRRRLLDEWKKSSLFSCTELDARQVEEDTARCQNAGEFLRTVMESMAREQGAERWAECTPDHLLTLNRIQKTLPDALVIHMIRDGRDVALSLAKQHWIRPFPWDHDKELQTAALYWEWIIGQGRRQAHTLGAQYHEIRYEDLVDNPHSTLARAGDFIGQDLDYEQILRVGYGSVRRPNSSFGTQGRGDDFQPVARWKKSLSGEQLEQVEDLIGKTLIKLGYEVEAQRHPRKTWAASKIKRKTYRAHFTSKLLLKTKTPLGRLAGGDLSLLGLQAEGPTHAPDALREPARILQIDATRGHDGERRAQIDGVTKELRRRGHFCETLRFGCERKAVDTKGDETRGSSGHLRRMWSCLFRGYSMDLHIDGPSRQRLAWVLIAALSARAIGRPALLTLHDNPVQHSFRGHEGELVHGAFYILVRVVKAIACDNQPVRDSIIRYGISSEKIHIPANPSEMTDWLTGDLTPEQQIPRKATVA